MRALLFCRGVRLKLCSAATGNGPGHDWADACRSLPHLNRCRGVEGSGRYLRYLTVTEVLRRYATAGQRKSRFIPEG